MKYVYIVLLILVTFSTNAQKVDYDNASKWYWGLNLGGTWQTTDVSNKTGVGWGIIVGKSFNYGYGKPISFDLRGRYLNGNWYGQDNDSTTLSGLNQGNALFGYQNGIGYTYHNYKSNVHRLALELAIHLNAITQKTGWDPYVFGGIGLTWNRTYGNLTDSTDFLVGPTLYDYQTNGPDAITFDNSYETALDGYSKYRVNVMPSLGFGLGYHIGKRTTLGIEHKTTFTLKDNFDGVSSSPLRAKSDWYHYTSLYINFRLRARNEDRTTSPNTNFTTTNPNSFTNCPAPIINLITQNNLTSNQATFKIQANVNNISSSNSIVFLGVNNSMLPFTYNSLTRNFEAVVTLTPGVNNYTITASNNCGSDSKVITINFINCNLPSGSFTNPMNNQVNVTNPNFALSALLTNVQSASNITVFQNGSLLSSPSFNPNSGVVLSNVILQPGINNFRIDFSNPCGNNSISTSVNYNNCVNPNIQITSPSASGSTVNSSNYIVTASVANLATGSLQVTLNGVTINNFTNNNGQLQIPVVLANGNNTVNIRVTNNCGTDSETTTLNFQNCNAPIVTINEPTMNSVVNTTQVFLKAKVENVTAKQGIHLLLNNINVPVFNFNNTLKLVDAALILVPGTNTITISSSNSCGSDIETVVIQYDNCKSPIVDVTNSTNQTVTNSAFNLTANIQNIPTSDGLSLTQNGSPINFSYFNGALTSSVSLAPGINTFKLIASRSCGNSSETIVVNYNDCTAPNITIIHPTASGITVNSASYNFKATISNISNNQQISFKLNGQNQPFVFNNGQLEANISLINGTNAIMVSVNNPCGTDSETTTINLVNCTPPQITVSNQNNAGLTVTNPTFAYQASITGAANSNAISFKQNGQVKPFTFVAGVLNSSLTLLPGNNIITVSVTNDCGVDIQTNTINFDNCISPVISFTNPTQLNVTTTNSQLNIQAQVTNSTSQGITLTQNGVNKNFNYSNNILSSTLQLIPGNNTIAVSTNNSCGNDVKFLNVNYNNCIEPVVSITQPSIPGNSVNTASFNFQASVQNMVGMQGITLTHNGNIVPGASINNGLVSATVTLISGLNTFSITARNSCGNMVQTSTINYNNCVAPVVTLSNPQNAVMTTTSASYNLVINALNVSNTNSLSFTQNGNPLTNFSFVNGQISANVNLIPGANNFYVNASNSCGNDSKNFTINYDNCKAPVISIANSANPLQPVVNPNYQFNANIQNMNSAQGISLMLNGVAIQNTTFVGNQLTANVVLSPGSNNFVLSAQNGCGNDNQTFSINYVVCRTPVINLTTNPISGSITTNSQLNFTAQVLNINANTILNITVNGSPLNSFSNNIGSISANITLSLGNNTIIMTAQNECGTDIESYTINYEQPINNDDPSPQTMEICLPLQGRNGNATTMTIQISEWPYYQSLGATQGPCSENNNVDPNSNGNNGHGNNQDGVDSSNPGQGSGGPNGQTDTNNGVDDENGSGNGSVNGGSNNGGSNGSGTGGNNDGSNGGNSGGSNGGNNGGGNGKSLNTKGNNGSGTIKPNNGTTNSSKPTGTPTQNSNAPKTGNNQKPTINTSKPVIKTEEKKESPTKSANDTLKTNNKPAINPQIKPNIKGGGR